MILFGNYGFLLLTDVLSVLDTAAHLGSVVWKWELLLLPSVWVVTRVEDLFELAMSLPSETTCLPLGGRMGAQA